MNGPSPASHLLVALKPFLREALELFRRRYGDEHLTVAASYAGLGLMYEARGAPDQAQALLRKSIERYHRLFLTDNQPSPSALLLLGDIDIKKGEYQEAEALYHEVINQYRKIYGHNHPDIVMPLIGLARLRRLEHSYGKAEEVRMALEIQKRTQPQGNLSTAQSLCLLSKILIGAGKPVQAERYLREALVLYRDIINKENIKPSTLSYSQLSEFGECLTMLKHYAEAEPLLREGYNGIKARLGEENPMSIEARGRLVKLYQAWEKPGQDRRYSTSSADSSR